MFPVVLFPVSVTTPDVDDVLALILALNILIPSQNRPKMMAHRRRLATTAIDLFPLAPLIKTCTVTVCGCWGGDTDEIMTGIMNAGSRAGCAVRKSLPYGRGSGPMNGLYGQSSSMIVDVSTVPTTDVFISADVFGFVGGIVVTSVVAAFVIASGGHSGNDAPTTEIIETLRNVRTITLHNCNYHWLY